MGRVTVNGDNPQVAKVCVAQRSSVRRPGRVSVVPEAIVVAGQDSGVRRIIERRDVKAASDETAGMVLEEEMAG